MPENKKYLIDVPGLEEVSGLRDVKQWEKDKKEFMTDFPEANVFEIGDVDPADAKEQDQYLLTIPGLEDEPLLWNSKQWTENKDAFLADIPSAKVQRIRHVDYWSQKAQEDEQRLAELNQPEEERVSRLAEIGYYDDEEIGFNMGAVPVGLKPLSSAMKLNSVSGEIEYTDPRVEEFFANDEAHTQRLMEKKQLQAEYDANPRVIERKAWEKAQEEVTKQLAKDIQSDMEAEVDLVKAARGRTAKHGFDALESQQMSYLLDTIAGEEAGSGSVENEKLERYQSALKLLKKAEQARESVWKGVGGSIADFAKEKVLDTASQSDIEMYNEVGDILTRLEAKIGNLDNVTEEDIEQNLSKDEQALIRAFYEYNAALQSANEHTSGWYKGGKIFAESIPFMLEFMVTGGAASGAGKVVQKGLFRAFAKWIGKKAAAKVGKVAGTVLGNATFRTLIAPSTYANMAEKSVEWDEEGHLHKGKNLVIGAVDSYIEQLSEMSGGAFKKVLGVPFKVADKAFNRFNLFGNFRFSKLGAWIGNNATMQTLANLGFHGMPEEIAEEIFGNALRTITHVDEKALKQMFEKDEFGAMLVGFAPMTLIGAGVSAARMGAVNIGAANAARRMRQGLAPFYTDKQIASLEGVVGMASTPNEIISAIKPMITGMLSGGASREEVGLVLEYAMAEAKKKALVSARSENELQLSNAKVKELEQLTGRFWMENPDGTSTVRQVALNDGRNVFIVGKPNAAGEVAIVDARTGKKGSIKESDIKKEFINSSLSAYGSALALNDRRAKERERIETERAANVQAMTERLQQDKRLNLGTEGAPNWVVVHSFDKTGINYVNANGKTHSMDWQRVSQYLNMPYEPKTDEQLVNEEIAAITQRDAQRRAQNAQADEAGVTQLTDAVENASTAQDIVNENEDNIPRNEDGSVNETAFWENDPEGYVRWNDEQNQDNGVDSLQQITNAKAELTDLLTQAQAQQNTSDPAVRKNAKAEAQRLAERIALLESLEQEYLERLKTPEQKRAEVEQAIAERAKEWEAKTGVKITIVQNPAEAPNPMVARMLMSGQEVFAWTENGEAFMYLPNIKSVEHLDEKFAHEVVAHVGLPALLGRENFNALLDRVWKSMSDTAKRHFLAYANVKGDTRIAAEEYLAHIAEKMGLSVTEVADSLNEEEKTVWQAIIEWLAEFFNNLFGNSVITEQEITNMIRNSYANLEARGKATTEAKSAAQEQIDALRGVLSAEELNEVASNDLAIAQKALEDLEKNAPKVEEGESSSAFIERKKAYNERLNAAKAEYDARKAIVDAIMAEQTPQTQQSASATEAEIQAQIDTQVAVEGNVTPQVQPNRSLRLSRATAIDWVDNLGNEHKGTMSQVLERMDSMGFSEEEKEEMRVKMQTMYDYMGKLMELTNEDGSVRFDEFNKWAETTPTYKQVGRDFVKAITSLVSNGDYPINLELTTDCIKREAFTQLLNVLVKRGANLAGMGPGEIVTIQDMMRQYGIQVACKLCFVEGKRLQIINWASQIVNDWNDALVEAGVQTDEFFEFGKDGDAFIPAEEWKTYEDKPKLAKMQRMIDDVALLFQGIDPKTFKNQKAKNKRRLEAYVKEQSEKWAKKHKKPASEWKPNDDQTREMKKIKNEGLAPVYVNENMKEYKEAYEALRNEWLEKHPGKDPLSFNPTKTQWKSLDAIRNRQIENVKAKMVRLIMEYPEMRKKMTMNDLLGSKGLMEIRQQHGAAYEQLYSIILQRFGTGTPKPVQDAVPYDGEVMTLSESAFKEANKIGGARLFSFSDFDITKVFDYMQMFFDLEANKQMLQSYTKEVGAVLLFGRSNAKFNISTLASAVVPAEVMEEYKNANEAKQAELRKKWAENAGLIVDEQGNITGINFSEEHSVSPDFAKQIFHDESRNKDCGAIMVGASVNHAIYSAAQEWIRMVIPFHLSGMPLAARDKTDVKWWTDNTAYQSTRKRTKDGWSKIEKKEDTFEFYADMHQEGWNMRDKAREYLEWCKQQGFRPKFDWGINSDYYRAYCEENGYTPNQQVIDLMDSQTTDGVWDQYYKFLTDFTAYKPVFNEEGEMIDEIPSPQQRVVTNFDMSDLEREVLFEGEGSMLERRESNIRLYERHMEQLADMTTAYLNGEVTEEELGLRDDLFFNSMQDANTYLDALAEEKLSNTEKDVRFSVSNNNQAIFVSNAAKAVEGIKQEKATPEQWLKMIEKNGGLKAGEDKWMGLSDWLKASDKKTLTKDEVMQFINDNMIVIEEQHYGTINEKEAMEMSIAETIVEGRSIEELQAFVDENAESASRYDDEAEDEDFNLDSWLMDRMVEEFGEDFTTYYTIENGYVEQKEVEWWDRDEDSEVIEDEENVRPIHSLREMYTTKGLTNNHEIALTVPTIKKWTGGSTNNIHFEDAGDGRAVAWIRFGETWEQRPSPEVSRKVLVIDEIQSKRHQEGREKGYMTKEERAKFDEHLDAIKTTQDALLAHIETLVKKYPNTDYDIEDVFKNFGAFSAEDKAKLRELKDTYDAEYARGEQLVKDQKELVEDAPFDKNWAELAMKRMLRYAAENGYGAIAWTTGEQQAKRYSIRKWVKKVESGEAEGFKNTAKIIDIYRRDGDIQTLHVDAKGNIIGNERYQGSKLSDLLGKDIAKKAMEPGEVVLEGENLESGEGMKGFYDKMLPAFMNKYGKKWGIKVEDINLPNLEDGLTMHSVPVTEEMKQSVMEGQLMFSTKSANFESAITPEVRKEMDVISAQAIVNGNYLKAPNGKDTKLTPEQWALVRTQNFINWFGDWINDPENASKVVDENGEPMVVYHGTPRAGFTEFKGGWFTTSKEDAISYSGDRKGRLFDPNEEYVPETLTAGDYRLGYMTFDSEEDRADFLKRFPTADTAMSESEYESARMQAEDEGYDTLTERKAELEEIWKAYREYERERFVDTTIGELLENPNAYTEDDFRRALLAYDSNVVFDGIDEMDDAEERKDELIAALNNANEETEGGILDLNVETRVPRNGEGLKHNDTNARTYEVYANIQSPYEVDANGRGSEFVSGDIYKAVEDALADEQYDGVIIRNWRVGRYQQLGDVVVPKNGNQIKLTSNANPTESEDIRFSVTTEQETPFIEDADTRFSVRTKPAPVNTKDVYKLMRLGEDGRLYPLFIGSAEAIDLGVWYDADSPNLGDLTKLASGIHLVNNETGEAMSFDEFKAQHPEMKIKKNAKKPNPAAINWATENGMRWVSIQEKGKKQKRYAGEKRSYYNLGINGAGGVGEFAMRPGWHAGSLPSMRQIGKGENKDLRDDSFVWVRGRVPADIDYQNEANANPDKDIPTHIPTDGFYMKATNANKKTSQADRIGWYVAGAFIADEIISDAEARRVIDEWNAEHPKAQVEYDYARESGREYDPARGGLVESENVRFSTRQPNQTAEQFHQAVVDDFKSKYKDIADIQVFPVNEETAKRFGYTLDELNEIGGTYISEEDLIAIFARENATDSNVIEEIIFHESVHKLYDFFDHLSTAGKWMWSVADQYKGFFEYKEYITENYTEGEYHEEMLSYMLGVAMACGGASKLYNGLPEDIQKYVDEIFNEIGYDRERESNERLLRLADESSVEEAEGSKREENGGRGESKEENGEIRFSTGGTPTASVVEKGLVLSVEDFAKLAGDIFSALPETMRNEVIEETFKNGFDMQTAIYQIPARLAEKESWSEEDKALARVIRDEVQKAVATSTPTNRPLTAAEALWMLYRSTEKGSGLVGEAQRAVVAHNLGFNPSALDAKERADEHIRFSAAQNSASTAAIDFYNYDSLLWTERMKETWLDMNQSVINLQEALAKATGKKIESWEDIVLALNQLSSKNYAEKKKYERDFLEPLWNVVEEFTKKPYGYTIEDVERYMMLKHGLERNRIFAARDAKAYYAEFYDKVEQRMKSQSDAQKQTALADARAAYDKAVNDVAKAAAKGNVPQRLIDIRDRAKLEYEIAWCVNRNDSNANAADHKAAVDAVDNGTDWKYKELREKDYGGLTAMYSKFDPSVNTDRSAYPTEEAYQRAMLNARTPIYDKVADMEAEAQNEVDTFESRTGSLTTELWAKTNAATKETLRHQFANNMLTTPQYDSVRTMFKYYVPLRGFDANTAGDMYSYYSSGNSTGFANPLIGAKGRKSKAESPLGWIGAMADSAIQMDNKNDAKMKLYNALLSRPDNGLVSVQETWYEYTGQKDANGRKIFAPALPPATNGQLSAADMEQHMQNFENSMRQKQAVGEAYKSSQRLNLHDSVVFQEPQQESEHCIRVKVAGQDYTMMINGNPRAAQAINGMLNPDANVTDFGRVYGALRRGMSSLLTSFSPLFWVANFQRDQLSSIQRTWMKYGAKQALKYAANRASAWRVASYVYKYGKQDLGNSYYENLYREFADNGGITGYTVLTRNTEFDQMLKDYIKDAKSSKIVKGFKKAWNAFMDFGEAIEQVSRFAAYITAREAGMDIVEAVNAAKEVSVNFNRKGSTKPISWEESALLRKRNGKSFNEVERAALVAFSTMPMVMKECYFFFNASIQALSSSAKMAWDKKGTAAAWAGLYLGVSFMMSVINSMFGDDDDEQYVDLPDYVRRSNLLIPVGDGIYLKRSLPQEMRPFYAMSDIMVQKMAGHMPHKSIGAELGYAMAEWLPVNPFGSESTMLSLIPDALSPVAEIWLNENNFGGKVYNDMPWLSEEVRENVPGARKATRNTGELYIDLAEIVNAVQGGDEVVAKGLQINPAALEHLAEGYLGGQYDMWKMFGNIASMLYLGEKPELKEVPFVNKVLLSVEETNMYTHTNDIYNYYKGIADNAKRVDKEYRALGQEEKADEFRETEDWRIYQLFLEHEAEMKEIADQLKVTTDENEVDLLRKSQNALREILLDQIAKESEPDPVLQIKNDVNRISKENSKVMKPARDAKAAAKKAQKNPETDSDEYFRLKDIADSLEDTEEYLRAKEFSKDIKEVKDILKELQSISRGPQRDSVIGELQMKYDALVKKANQR